MFYGLPKNLVYFFRNEDIPHTVTIYITNSEAPKSDCGKSKIVKEFLCSSIILAIHSERFQRIISTGNGEIYLECFQSPSEIEAVKHSLEFMYGDRSAVRRADDISAVCKFSEIWDIQSLWLCCLAHMKACLSYDPLKLFDYYKILGVVSERNWRRDELWREFDKVARENADILIQYVIDERGAEVFDERICKGLIKNSKTIKCGKYISLLVKRGGDSKKFLMDNMDLIPVNTAFANGTEFRKFEKLFKSSSEWCRFTPLIVRFDENSGIPEEESVVSLNQDVAKQSRPKKSNNQSRPEQTPFDIPSSSGSSNPSFSRDDAHESTPVMIDVKPEPLELKAARKKERLLKKLFSLRENSRRHIPLADYPELIKNFSLHTRLDIILHFVSESTSLNERNILNLLSSFYENPLISVHILEDINKLAMSKCSTGCIPERLKDSFLEVASPKRLETFSMTKIFYDVSEFCAKLLHEKRIIIPSDGVAQCPLIWCDLTDNFFGHTLEGFSIDFCSESGVQFTSSQGAHLENMLHCYMVLWSVWRMKICHVIFLYFSTVLRKSFSLLITMAPWNFLKLTLFFFKETERSEIDLDTILVKCLRSSTRNRKIRD